MINEEFENWLLMLGYSEEVQNIIRFNRNAPPARQVRSSGKNVVVKYASIKNGETIPCESQLELACAMKLERDPGVLEYRSQRPIYTAYYKNKKGKTAGHRKTCDFIAFKRNGVEMIECKPEEMLNKLAEKNPDLYKKAEGDKWICPPGEGFAKPLGFSFTVFSSTAINWKFQRNADFLFDYFVDDPTEVSSDAVERITALVRAEPGISYDKLTNIDDINPDDVNMLIATNRIYVDLEKELLADSKETHIFVDENTAKAHVVQLRALSPHLIDINTVDIEVGQKVKWNEVEWIIAAYDQTHISLYAHNGTVIKPLMTAFEELVKTGEITGLNRIASRSDAEKQYDQFFKKANKKNLKIWNRRMNFHETFNSMKGGLKNGQSEGSR